LPLKKPDAFCGELARQFAVERLVVDGSGQQPQRGEAVCVQVDCHSVADDFQIADVPLEQVCEDGLSVAFDAYAERLRAPGDLPESQYRAAGAFFIRWF